MKMALCMHSPLWAERHLLSWGRCQSWLAVTHLLAGRKEVGIRAVIFSLCSYSSHSMAVGCVSAHRCWCLVHTDTCGTNTAHSVPAGEAPARAQHLCFGLYQVTTINLVMGSFSYHWRYFEVSASMWTQDEHVLSFLFQLWNFCVLALSCFFRVTDELNTKHLYLQLSTSVHSCEPLGLCHFCEHRITKGQGPSE